MTVPERLLDASDLEPPEPLMRALALLAELPHGDYLRMKHRREPFLLYENLESKGFAYKVLAGRDTPCEIFVWHQGDAEAEASALDATTGLAPFAGD